MYCWIWGRITQLAQPVTPVVRTLEVLSVTPEHTERIALQFFRVVWSDLCRYHFCDQAGGAEYRRVWSVWLREGCPLPLAPFIMKHANASSEVTP